MTYNNYYPAGVSAVQAHSGMVWVQGESGAKGYLVAPNSSVVLFDSESDKFYIKAADASGMPLPLRVFEFTEVSAAQKGTTGDESLFVTKAEFAALKRVVDGLSGGIKDEQSV